MNDTDETPLESLTPEEADRIFGPRVAGFMRAVIMAANQFGMTTGVVIYEQGGAIGGFSTGSNPERCEAARRVTFEGQKLLALALTPIPETGRGN